MLTPPTHPDPELDPNPKNFAQKTAVAGGSAAVPEADLARACGLQREDMKKLRAAHLVEGEDWTGGNGRPVLVTELGQGKLRGLMAAQKKEGGAGAVPVQASAQKGAGEALAHAAEAVRAGSLYVTLVVHPLTSTSRNRRLVLAAASQDAPAAELVRVEVKRADLFKAGMVLERCMPSATTPGYYHYHGRMPRRAGKF